MRRARASSSRWSPRRLAPGGGRTPPPDVEVGIEDERLHALRARPRARRRSAEWAALGVDVVRIHARWFEVAPAQEARRRPSGFDAANHRDRRYDWATLDAAVAAGAARNGMRVMLTVTGPGPAVDEQLAAPRQPALPARPEGVRPVRPRGGVALRPPASTGT